ncbi:MAG TPA: UDP-N-acetylmuramoyl-L-alanine--D-glutamate ligase [Micromonosporaceae bacterium]|jgi:UDP-N-acetylmuramoylalanine--D-glutamate ligase
MNTAPGDGDTSYAGRRVLVAGSGIAGAACVEVLLELGASVVVLDRTESAALVRLKEAGAEVLLGEAPDPALLAALDDVIVSPGFAPHTPVARAALAAGLPVYSEPELAWRLRGPSAPTWLAVTGTNGKTTTTTMLAAMLRAAGHRTAALGNIGEPLVHAGTGDRFDVLAVELSSFQLYWSQTLAPQAGALLNLADDHLEWHGDFDSYATAKLAIWRAASTADGIAIGNLDDPLVAAKLRAVTSGRRAGAPRGRLSRVGVTLGEPHSGELGVVDGVLVDRAFAEGDGAELGPADGVRPAGTHNVSNALHAAALARSYGVSTQAIRSALAGYEPKPHRNALVARVADVSYVDDSKATNPHAALASLTAYPRVVWVAGGQLKGVDVSDLVATVADRLVGAVLLGVDRAEVAQALRRHAPNVPVVDVSRTDDGAMVDVVRAAAGLARAGDTVLLAPAAASKDMFTGYDQRGDAFAEAVRSLFEVSP